MATNERGNAIVNQYLSDGNPESLLANLQGSLEQFPSAVVITDETGRPKSYNHLTTQLIGKIPAEVTPEKWPEKYGLYQPDGNTLFPGDKFPLLRALRGEKVSDEVILRKGGHPVKENWLSMSAKPLVSANGRTLGAMLFISDITASKQMELSYLRKIKQTEEASALQQRIAEIGNDPLKILNLVVSFAAINIGDGCIAALLNMPGDRLKVVAFDHRLPEGRDLLYKSIWSEEYRLENAIERIIRTGEPLLLPEIDPNHVLEYTQPNYTQYIREYGLESLLVVPIKGRNRILGTLSLVRDHQGKSYTIEDQAFMVNLAYWAGLAIDNNYLVNLVHQESSSRKFAEEALELSEARFHSIFTSTPFGIKLLDLNGVILESNPAFQQMTGYSESELIGKSITKLWHPADAKYLSQVIEKLKYRRAQNLQIEHRIINKNHTVVWMNVTYTGIKKNDREESLAFIAAIAENITLRKQIEADMAKMKSRLQSHVELERLRLAQELHDGPLQDLYSSIYKIEGWIKQPTPVRTENLTGLKQDLLVIIQELRNTAKDLRPPALVEFGLEKAIRSHAQEFQENHPGISIELNLAHDGKILTEDIRLILFRIYQHSMANILRHSEACEVIVRFTFDAEEANLEISDNGTGFVVPTNWMELVRQGHYGLAGVVERVSLLNGKFTVDSKPGDGTTVRVAIPIITTNDTKTVEGDD